MMSANDGKLTYTARRLARGMVFPAVAWAWELVFLLTGKLLRPAAKRLVPGGSERVLVVAPHPDDETVGCGGTIARHIEARDQVRVLVVTDGGNSRAGGVERDEMRRLREMEAHAAMRALGTVDLVQLGLPEGSWTPDDLQRPLEAILRHGPPSLIYAPSCVDFHPEHVEVARVLAQALRPQASGTLPKVRVYEIQVPLTPALANVAIEVGGTAAAKKALALAEYRTQQGSLGCMTRHRRYLRRLYRSRAPVEVFWEMDSAQYCRLMEAGGRMGKYRGLRPRPFSDGLAWLAGSRERRQLMKLVRGKAAR